MDKKLIKITKLSSLTLLATLLVSTANAQTPPAATSAATEAGTAPVVAKSTTKAVEAAKTKEPVTSAPLAGAVQSADPKIQEEIKKLLGNAPAEAKKAGEEKVATQGGLPAKTSDASDKVSGGLKFTAFRDDYDDDYDEEDDYALPPQNKGQPNQAQPTPPAPVDPITKAVNDAIKASINDTEKNLETYKTAQANFMAAVAGNNLGKVIETGPAYKDALIKATASVVGVLDILQKDSAKNLLGNDTIVILTGKYNSAKTELDTAANLGK